MRKRNIIIIAAVLVIAIIAVLNLTKKPAPKYTTAEVARGEVLQTVSATGTVEAAKKLDLRFVNSGKIKEINARVGDRVESGKALAKLDTVQLESQLAKAKASLGAATANLSKILEGATAEDIKVSETAVENAQVAFDNSKRNLEDAKISAEKEIANAQASLNSAKTTLNNANSSLNNAKISNENNLNRDYEDGWNTVNSSLLTAFNSLNTNTTTLEYEDAQDTLSVINTQYLNESSQSKTVAESSYDNVKIYIKSVKSNLTYENIDEALAEMKSALENIRDTLSDTGDILQATITSSKLSQTELDALKADISAARSNVNVAISNVTAAQQNIAAQRITNQTSLDSAEAAVNSAQSALELAERSLAATQAASSAKINSAQNAVESAEGALKQAQDQLAFKKAGSRTSEISLYKAQVQEAQANVNLIQSQIDDSVLIAPQEGIITEINGEVGEIAAPTATFISMIATENFEIKSNVSEVDIAKVKISDEVDITFDALGSDKKFKGKITDIDPAQTEISGVIYYKVTAMFVGDAEIIKPGMTANLDIMTAKKDNVIMIPFQALKEKNGQDYAQILENGTARDALVEVGLKGDINLEIISGLKEGQMVITFMEE